MRPQYLNVGSLHRLFVSSGSVALVINDGVGAIIDQSGETIFNSATFEYKVRRVPGLDFSERVHATPFARALRTRCVTLRIRPCPLVLATRRV